MGVACADLVLRSKKFAKSSPIDRVLRPINILKIIIPNKYQLLPP